MNVAQVEREVKWRNDLVSIHRGCADTCSSGCSCCRHRSSHHCDLYFLLHRQLLQHGQWQRIVAYRTAYKSVLVFVISSFLSFLSLDVQCNELQLSNSVLLAACRMNGCLFRHIWPFFTCMQPVCVSPDDEQCCSSCMLFVDVPFFNLSLHYRVSQLEQLQI